MGESGPKPGPIGWTWAPERSDERHDQPERAVGSKSALVLTSRDVWEPTQELVFGRYPLRRGLTLVREIWRWYWVGSDWKYDEAKQVSGGTHSDPDWYPPATEETDHTRNRPMRKGQADEVLRGVW